MRVISHVVIRIKQNKDLNKIVGLITIYDKSEYNSISDKELIELISEIEQEIRESDSE
jgi:Ca2+-binding EF-hand superfamily protein